MKNKKVIKVLILVLVLVILSAHVITKKMLFSAVDNNDIETVQTLINLGVTVNQREYVTLSIQLIVGQNPTPLLEACSGDGSTDMVRLLLDAGADVNGEDSLTGDVPLLRILHSGRSDRYQIAWDLVQRGADINVKLNTESVLDNCIEKSDSPLLSEGNSFFIYVAENILSYRLPVNTTVLHRAVQRGNYELACYILEHGMASVSALDLYDKTPLDYALESNDPMMIDLLRKYDVPEFETDVFYRYYRTDSDQADAVFQLIISAIESQDAATLKDLFSEYAIDTSVNIDDQISRLFDFYEGETVTFFRYGPGSHTEKEGNLYVMEIFASYDVKTTSGDYRIAVKFCTMDSSNPENIGLRSIYIMKAEDSDLNYAYWGGDVWNVGINIEGTAAE